MRLAQHAGKVHRRNLLDIEFTPTLQIAAGADDQIEIPIQQARMGAQAGYAFLAESEKTRQRAPRGAVPSPWFRGQSVRLRMVSTMSESHALLMFMRKGLVVASQTGIELVLPQSLFNALGAAARDNGRSMEAEAVNILSRHLLAQKAAMTDSTTALEAVGVVLGIDGSGAAPRGF